MFERGLFIDGNWIANGEWFCQVSKIENKEFIKKFKRWIDNSEPMSVRSGPFLFNNQWRCILLSSNNDFYPVQVDYLKMIGIDIDEIDDYQFEIAKEQRMIFVHYEGSLLGGLMPILIMEY